MFYCQRFIILWSESPNNIFRSIARGKKRQGPSRYLGNLFLFLFFSIFSRVRSKTPPEGYSVFLSYEISMCKTAIEHPRVLFSNASRSRRRFVALAASPFRIPDRSSNVCFLILIKENKERESGGSDRTPKKHFVSSNQTETLLFNTTSLAVYIITSHAWTNRRVATRGCSMRECADYFQDKNFPIWMLDVTLEFVFWNGSRRQSCPHVNVISLWLVWTYTRNVFVFFKVLFWLSWQLCVNNIPSNQVDS